jgi:hypothetical protein
MSRVPPELLLPLHDLEEEALLDEAILNICTKFTKESVWTFFHKVMHILNKVREAKWKTRVSLHLWIMYQKSSLESSLATRALSCSTLCCFSRSLVDFWCFEFDRSGSTINYKVREANSFSPIPSDTILSSTLSSAWSPTSWYTISSSSVSSMLTL